MLAWWHTRGLLGRLHLHTPFIGCKVLTKHETKSTMHMGIGVLVLSTHLPVYGIGRFREIWMGSAHDLPPPPHANCAAV